MPRVALRRAKALLDATSTRLLGVCLSGVRPDLSSDYAEMASYGYRYAAEIERAKPGPTGGSGAVRRRLVRWGAAIAGAVLIVTGAVWLSRLISSAQPRPTAADRPALPAAVAGAPPAREGSKPATFTIRLSVPGRKGSGPGTVSIGQFESETEAEAYGRELTRTGVITSFTVVPLAPEP